jgi:hypothetical protein
MSERRRSQEADSFFLSLFTVACPVHARLPWGVAAFAVVSGVVRMETTETLARVVRPTHGRFKSPGCDDAAGSALLSRQES